jgi:hypothetical protein
MFVPNSNRHHMCSDPCRNERHAEQAKARRRAHLRIIPCIICGKSFKQSHPNKKLCSDSCKKARQTQLWFKNKDLWTSKVFEQKYGISLVDVVRMLETQSSQCAICCAPINLQAKSTNKDRAHVDHCHNTGKVRSLLCASCNWMLGNGKDDPSRLRAGATYLETWRALLGEKKSA